MYFYYWDTAPGFLMWPFEWGGQTSYTKKCIKDTQTALECDDGQQQAIVMDRVKQVSMVHKIKEIK